MPKKKPFEPSVRLRGNKIERAYWRSPEPQERLPGPDDTDFMALWYDLGSLEKALSAWRKRATKSELAALRKQTEQRLDRLGLKEPTIRHAARSLAKLR